MGRKLVSSDPGAGGMAFGWTVGRKMHLLTALMSLIPLLLKDRQMYLHLIPARILANHLPDNESTMKGKMPPSQ